MKVRYFMFSLSGVQTIPRDQAGPGSFCRCPTAILSFFSRYLNIRPVSGQKSLQVGDNATGESIDVIAALKSADQPAWRNPVPNIPGEPCEIFPAKGEPAEGVLSMGIESGADEDKIRIKVFKDSVKVPAEELPVGSGLEAGLQRTIQSGPLAGALSLFPCIPGPGVKRRLVERIIKNSGVGIEDVLCSIAVMNIPVDDEYFPAAHLLEVPGGNGHRVEQAEAHRPRGGGVMPGRPNKAECRGMFSSITGFNC